MNKCCDSIIIIFGDYDNKKTGNEFGPDFPTQYLTEHKINLINSESKKNTTKFSISISGSDRTLKLENECDPIEYSNLDADGHIVSPIFHEISDDVFKKIKSDSGKSSLMF